MLTSKLLSFSIRITLLFIFYPFCAFCQTSQYTNTFDYTNINTQTFVPVSGFNDTQNHHITILKHSFDVQRIISYPKDSFFVWNGLKGQKTIYTKDSLILFFVRPNDTITRPCILLTHGNGERYRSSWNEHLNFYAIDLAMRGFCVAYYENTSSFESVNKYATMNGNTRKAFYNGFQAAVAADMYVTENVSLLKIDTTKLFAGGVSFGAFCSLSLSSADVGKNFTDTLFNAQGNFSSKSIYNTVYRKNIKRAFVIGGGLPKDDTIAVNNSKMGNFLEESDSSLAFLFLHGRTDNLVLFDVTKFGSSDTVSTYFYTEGPRALINNIQEKDLSISTKLFVNCKGGHPFFTTVCGNNNSNCIQQYQWLYLNEPPNNLSVTSPYFTSNLTDTLLHYFVYMATQVDDIDFIVSDFLKPAITNATSTFTNNIYFIQPRDTFTYVNPSGHYIFRSTDCEGNAIVITNTRENYSAKSEVTVYPNPSSNFIFFESKEIIQSIRIYSILGALIKEVNSNNFQQQLDVSDFTNGEYICLIQLKDEILTKKISVIR